MKPKSIKSSDYAVYKSFEMVYLQLMRFYLKQKMEIGITNTREEEIKKIMAELDESFQMVKDWYANLPKKSKGLDKGL